MSKLTFYMKSGNKIIIKHVSKYSFTTDFKGDLTGAEYTRKTFWPGEHLLMATMDLSQVEAITVD